MQENVVLDPGHGGTQRRGNATPEGAHFDNGQREEHVNYQLAQRVAQHLGGAHFTRGARDSRSLGERIEVARYRGAQAFISLHTNPGSGGDVWVHPRSSPQSVQLAEMIRAQLNPAFGGRGPERRARRARSAEPRSPRSRDRRVPHRSRLPRLRRARSRRSRSTRRDGRRHRSRRSQSPRTTRRYATALRRAARPLPSPQAPLSGRSVTTS